MARHVKFANDEEIVKIIFDTLQFFLIFTFFCFYFLGTFLSNHYSLKSFFLAS